MRVNIQNEKLTIGRKRTNWPWISPHTVTGHLTGWTFDSSISISRVYEELQQSYQINNLETLERKKTLTWVTPICLNPYPPTLSQSRLTSTSESCLHWLSCSIQPSISCSICKVFFSSLLYNSEVGDCFGRWNGGSEVMVVYPCQSQ